MLAVFGSPAHWRDRAEEMGARHTTLARTTASSACFALDCGRLWRSEQREQLCHPPVLMHFIGAAGAKGVGACWP
jgi:hypothetical protein